MSDIAVIFDMDGVIIDNHHFHMQAWEKFCQKYDILLNNEEFKENVTGRTVADAIRYIFNNKVSEEELKKYSEEKEALYRELYEAHIKPVKGLAAFLEQLAANNIPRAIATSAPAVNVAYVLKHVHISRYFDTIIDSTHIKYGKPNPEIYLKAAQTINMPPEKCVVFEDSISGVRAARNAGMKVVGLTTTHQREELTEVDLVKNNFEELTIEEIKSLFSI
jgi:beta-phosphoglucomutase